MKVLLDTNIFLDEIMRRQPFCEKAADIIALARLGHFTAFVSVSAAALASFLAWVSTGVWGPVVAPYAVFHAVCTSPSVVRAA
jgi:predicted nucleic acid-binding protein